MSIAIIKKSVLNGIVNAPPSKSAAHRTMICAALSRSKCYVINVCRSDDIYATRSCLKELGARITTTSAGLIFKPTGFVQENSDKNFTLNCDESGTTLRIMIPICAALGLNVTFVGEGRLPQRPLYEYIRLLPQHGVAVEKGEHSLPLTISGKLCGDVFEISPAVSSQYVSGMLFALSLLKNDTTLILKSELAGSQYVDITIDVMKKFGVNVTKTENRFFIKGGQKYKPISRLPIIDIEGDWSQAAFFLCAGAMGGDVTVSNLDINSTQGDKKIVDFLKAFGADVTVGKDYVHVRKSDLKATTIDALDTPDLVPVVAVLSSFAQGDTTITGVSRLKFKESDRLLSTCDMINSLGGHATYSDDTLFVRGVGSLKGGKVNGYNDHRIVMSSAVAALMCENDVTVSDAHAINKSYSNFFDDYQNLGGKADVILG